MKFYPGHPAEPMPESATTLLARLRAQRNFDPDVYLEAKAKALNGYMRKAGLKSCVIAISGGIDSAAVAGIVAHAYKQIDSPIENIVAVTLPVHKDNFTKNQSGTVTKSHELGEALGIDVVEIDLTHIHAELLETVGTAVDITPDDWAGGQGVALARTAPLYLLTNLEKQMGRPAILCGTTNRDEGAYLGYVGKASDGMVDVQLISDLHKSEVRALAQRVGVPASILNAAPTGDMYDGREDEAVFGASFDYVELMLLLRSLPEDLEKQHLETLPDDDRAHVQEAFDNLEELHAFNGHKYKVGSPAYHLDIMESGVRGGWPYHRSSLEREPRTRENFINPFNLSVHAIRSISHAATRPASGQREIIAVPKGQAEIMHEVMDPDVIQALLSEADAHGWLPANLHGNVKGYKQGDPVGSWRASVFSPELADMLWARIAPNIPATRVFDNDPQIEVEPGSIWRPIGVNPYCRFIRYTEGGALVPHYDGSVDLPESEGLRTHKSVVVYLDANGVNGGATRFLHDDRLDDPLSVRDLSDREALATEDDVDIAIEPDVGSALVFDHVLLHDGQRVTPTAPNGQKVIMRTELVYELC